MKMAATLFRLTLFFILFVIVQSRLYTWPPQTIHLPLPLLFSVVDYGAIGDGRHYDTAAIQEAIDACHSAGGGHVRFPPGTYLTATVYIKSGVYLVVEEGAKILGGTKLEDYPAERRRWYVVLAENATDVGITGGGVIDGHGMKFVKSFGEAKNVMVSWNETGACLGDECRPRLVGFLGSRNVRVWNIHLNEPAYWWCVLHPSFSLSPYLTSSNQLVLFFSLFFFFFAVESPLFHIFLFAYHIFILFI